MSNLPSTHSILLPSHRIPSIKPPTADYRTTTRFLHKPPPVWGKLWRTLTAGHASLNPHILQRGVNYLHDKDSYHVEAIEASVRKILSRWRHVWLP
jgi:hypothetical protein